LIGNPSTAASVDVPDAVYDAVTPAPCARFGVVEVRSTPALANMSTIRALPCATCCGACNPLIATLWFTVPDPDGNVTSPLAGL
jgi:hypothetical protein